jgi:hypothetical protein
MTRVVEADYLVVGAGATGMAFTDALVDHDPTARVALVDRRPAPGGHWLDAYPFVRLHQSSSFYGVASTLLGGGRIQQEGPEAGLHERATAPEICAYYGHVLADRLQPSGRVEFFPATEYVGRRQLISRISGATFEVPERCRVVDAHYVAPDIPALTPPPFEVGPGAAVVPANDVVRTVHAPSEWVVVGSGKTGTDTIVWLLGQGVDPDRICWVRPRDPWMFDRARVQPDPAVFLDTAADIMSAAGAATDLEDLFLRLERSGVLMRLDPAVVPTMARVPTLGRWELDLLQTVERVVRRGHLRRVDPGRLRFDEGDLRVPTGALVVHCAASGLKNPPLLPVFAPDAVTLQPIRAGFPSFGAALVGYVEATRDHDDEKNRLCPPSPYGNTLHDWAEMNLRGFAASLAFGAEPDIRAWANGIALSPTRVPPDREGAPEVVAAQQRFQDAVPGGLAGLRRLTGISLP